MIDARSEHARLDTADDRGWWASLVDVYREEAARADDVRAGRHLCEAARIRLEELGDTIGAARLYVEAYGRSPDDPLPARALAGLAEQAGDHGDARRWLEAALEATPDGPGRVSLLARLGGILHDRLGEREAAAKYIREALALAPDDRALLSRLALLVDEDDPAGRATLLERRLAVADDPGRRAALLVDLGRLREAADADDGAALDAYRAAFDAAPDYAPGLDGMVRVLLRTERFEDLVTALDRAVERVTDPVARGRLHMLAAMVLGIRLDAPERARPHLGAAVNSLGDDPVAAAELAGLYERLGLWTQANDVLRRSADADTWYRIGLNLESGMGDTAGAIDAQGQALAADPDALLPLAALRRCAWRGDDVAGWQRATDGLLRIAVDPGARAALCTHVADVLSLRVGDDDVARRRYGEAVQDAWRAARRADAMLPPAFEERVRLLQAEQKWTVLEEELRQALDRPLHPLARSAVSGRLAELCEGPLGRPDEALELYGRVTADDPDDVHAHDARQRLLAARGDWPALLDALRQERDRVDARRRAIVLTRMADVQTLMGDPEGAESTWREALELDPGWLPALRGLGRQLHQHGRWRDLATLHRHEVATLGPDDPRRAALWGKLAELYEFRLDQPDDALECYEALLAIRPGAPDAVAGLERLYRQGERWAALSRVLSGRAEALDDPAARAAVLIRLADVRLDRLEDPAGARVAYEEAVRLMPELLPAGWALERLALVEGDDARLAEIDRHAVNTAATPGQRAIARHKLATVVDPLEATPTLEAAYEENADPDAAWALVREAATYGDEALVAVRLAAFAQTVEHRRDGMALWLEAAEQGEAAELPADDLAALWTRVARLDPAADRPRAALLRLHRASGTPGAVAELLLARAEETEDARERSLALWSAGLIEESRGMPSVGIDAFREALTASELDPTPAWLLLDRARETGDLSPRQEAEQWVAIARRQADGPTAAQHLQAAADLRAQTLEDPEGALPLYLEAVRRDPAAAEAARRAETMLEARGAWSELAALLEHQAERLDAPARLVPVLGRLADVQLDHLGARAEAAETLERRVALAPNDLDSRVRLGDLRYSLDHFEQAATHYRKAVLSAHDDRLLGRLYTRLGRIKAHHLDDVPGAIEDLRRAVGLGTDERALGELAQVYLMAGEADLALMAFQRLEKLADDPNDLSAARAGQVHALLRRGRRAEAVERLTAFRAIDPVDPMLATLARDLELPTPDDGEPDEPLVRPAPGRALAASPLATGTAIAALDLRRQAAESGESVDSIESNRPLEDRSEVGRVLDVDISIDLAGLDDVPGGPSPESLDEARAVSVDIDAAFDALGDGATPDLLSLDDAPANATVEVHDLDVVEVSDEETPLRPPTRPPALPPTVTGGRAGTGPIADKPVEAVRIPSPLDEDSLDSALAMLDDGDLGFDGTPGPFDGMADTGSIQTLDPLDDTGALDLRALDAARAQRTGGSPAALLEALPAASVDGLDDNDVSHLLQPDIERDRLGSGSLPAVRPATGGDDVDDAPSLDLDASTATFATTDIAQDTAGRYVSGQPTTPLSPRELALERVRVSPLDTAAWSAMAAAVDPTTRPWIDDTIAWIDGEVRPPIPSSNLGVVPDVLAFAVRPDGTPEALCALLRAVAPHLIGPTLAEGRRRARSQGGRPIDDGSPLAAMARRTAARLGIDPVPLVENPERPYSVALDTGDDGGLNLILGSAILESADPVGQSFLLARSLIPVAFGTLPARQLRQRESRAFFGALLTLLGSPPPLRGRDRQRIEGFSAQLAPVIEGHPDRKTLEVLGADVASHVRKSGIAGLRSGLDLFDNRLALSLAEGFGGALEMLRLLDFDDRPRDVLGPEEMQQIVTESDLARDLIAFAADPRCHAVRRWLSET